MPSHDREHRRSHDRDVRRRTRSRSRSPRPSSHDRRHKHRSRSPRRHHSHRHHESSRSKHKSATPATLPFNARQISKRDYDAFKPMFALYLDIQKQLILEDLGNTEARGRWKSFVGRWNRGELAEGWYDPATLQKAANSAGEGWDDGAAASHSPAQQRKGSPDYNTGGMPGSEPRQNRGEDDDSEDEFGPALPSDVGFMNARRSGPAIPRIEDLALRKEHEEEDALASRDDLRYARRADRALQKERLEELAPRADPGSRERQLEKKREKTSALNDFRNAKEAGDAEVGDNELMGDDGVEGFKARRKEEERRKNEREIRKEEILRARAAEREERLAEFRAREEEKVDMLRGLAKQRWGQGF